MRRVAAGLAISLLGLVTAALAAELGLRFEDFANPVRLNALGFHDRDYAPERPTPSTYRIMVLGDSYVAAWEVLASKPSTSALKRASRRRTRSGGARTK